MDEGLISKEVLEKAVPDGLGGTDKAQERAGKHLESAEKHLEVF